MMTQLNLETEFKIAPGFSFQGHSQTHSHNLVEFHPGWIPCHVWCSLLFFSLLRFLNIYK